MSPIRNNGPQIFYLRTRFSFGKFLGKSLYEVISMGESNYISWLIAIKNPIFILHPETIEILNYHDFFNDLHISVNIRGEAIPLRDLNLSKEDIITYLKATYDEYIKDPIDYEKKVKRYKHLPPWDSGRYFRIDGVNEANLRLLQEEYEGFFFPYQNEYDGYIGTYQDEYMDFENDEPIEFGSSRDRNENPWLDILPDDEAEDAYWNTQ